MKLVKFKNGSINIKMEKEDNISSFREAIEAICNDLDFYTMEDTQDTQHNEYSLGNSYIAYDLYHNGDDSVYYMFTSYAYYNKLLQGKTVKIYAQKNIEKEV